MCHFWSRIFSALVPASQRGEQSKENNTQLCAAPAKLALLVADEARGKAYTPSSTDWAARDAHRWHEVQTFSKVGQTHPFAQPEASSDHQLCRRGCISLVPCACSRKIRQRAAELDAKKDGKTWARHTMAKCKVFRPFRVGLTQADHCTQPRSLQPSVVSSQLGLDACGRLMCLDRVDQTQGGAALRPARTLQVCLGERYMATYCGVLTPRLACLLRGSCW
jgi:hypothetical protein